jgi:hypothetical protein
MPSLALERPMTVKTPKHTQEFLSDFLGRIRRSIDNLSIDTNRLPNWVKFANIRAGWINDSLVAVFDDSQQKDSFSFKGSIGADTVLFFEVENYMPKDPILRSKKETRLITIVGEVGESGNTTIDIVGERPAMFDCGYVGYHGPLAISNMFLQLKPEENAIPVATRLLQLAIYGHKKDVEDTEKFWNMCEEGLTDTLKSIAASPTGDYYERLNKRSSTFLINKQNGVIVLGKDSDDFHLNELLQIRDFLRNKGYRADLIKDLPEIPMMSNKDKVRLWTIASRFCIMVDRTPSGHIAEYEILRQQSTIFAFMHPKGTGSTRMIGDDALVDVNYIHPFAFASSPLEALEDAITWAEQMAKARQDAYDREYPWRQP